MLQRFTTLVIVQPNWVSLWSVATRRRLSSHAATSCRTPCLGGICGLNDDQGPFSIPTGF